MRKPQNNPKIADKSSQFRHESHHVTAATSDSTRSTLANLVWRNKGDLEMHSNITRLMSMLLVASAFTLVDTNSPAHARRHIHDRAWTTETAPWRMQGETRWSVSAQRGAYAHAGYQGTPDYRNDSQGYANWHEQYSGSAAYEGARVRRAERPAHRGSRVASLGRGTYGASSGAGSDLVSEARRWIGTNPTGWAHVWCGRFMNFVLERTGRRGTGSNTAFSFAGYGRRVSGPQVGAIAVMGRRGGGHVGVVSGIDPHGNPILISGNHGHQVAEAVYPRGRISVYVVP
jgi:uncharacterized protein (TIGR02594 family)